MSETEATILGKRERETEEARESNGGPKDSAEATDDSDDDIGPMPMPAGAAGAQATRKKRKSTQKDAFLIS